MLVHLVEDGVESGFAQGLEAGADAVNQPGTIWRDWVQPKTQGMARRPSRETPEPGAAGGP
ncbi:hypothetical protein SCALM49S_02881 [Streptomyces californicus]